MKAKQGYQEKDVMKRRKSKQSTLRRTPQRRAHLQKYDDEDFEIDQLRDQLMDNPDFSGINLPKLIKLEGTMNDFINGCISNRTYTLAKRARDLETMLKNEIEAQAQAFQQYTKRNFGSSSVIKQSRKKIEKSNDPILKEFDHDTEIKKQELEYLQNRERIRFDNKWNRKMLKQPNNNAKINELREIQDECNELGDVEGEYKCQNAIDELEAENEMLQTQLAQEYQRGQENLQRKQASQLSDLLSRRKAQRNLLVQRSAGMQFRPIEYPPKPRSITASQPNKHIQTGFTSFPLIGPLVKRKPQKSKKSELPQLRPNRRPLTSEGTQVVPSDYQNDESPETASSAACASCRSNAGSPKFTETPTMQLSPQSYSGSQNQGQFEEDYQYEEEEYEEEIYERPPPIDELFARHKSVSAGGTPRAHSSSTFKEVGVIDNQIDNSKDTYQNSDKDDNLEVNSDKDDNLDIEKAEVRLENKEESETAIREKALVEDHEQSNADIPKVEFVDDNSPYSTRTTSSDETGYLTELSMKVNIGSVDVSADNTGRYGSEHNSSLSSARSLSPVEAPRLVEENAGIVSGLLDSSDGAEDVEVRQSDSSARLSPRESESPPPMPQLPNDSAKGSAGATGRSDVEETPREVQEEVAEENVPPSPRNPTPKEVSSPKEESENPSPREPQKASSESSSSAESSDNPSPIPSPKEDPPQILHKEYSNSSEGPSHKEGAESPLPKEEPSSNSSVKAPPKSEEEYSTSSEGPSPKEETESILSKGEAESPLPKEETMEETESESSSNSSAKAPPRSEEEEVSEEPQKLCENAPGIAKGLLDSSGEGQMSSSRKEEDSVRANESPSSEGEDPDSESVDGTQSQSQPKEEEESKESEANEATTESEGNVSINEDSSSNGSESEDQPKLAEANENVAKALLEGSSESESETKPNIIFDEKENESSKEANRKSVRDLLFTRSTSEETSEVSRDVSTEENQAAEPPEESGEDEAYDYEEESTTEVSVEPKDTSSAEEDGSEYEEIVSGSDFSDSDESSSSGEEEDEKGEEEEEKKKGGLEGMMAGFADGLVGSESDDSSESDSTN